MDQNVQLNNMLTFYRCLTPIDLHYFLPSFDFLPGDKSPIQRWHKPTKTRQLLLAPNDLLSDALKGQAA